VAAFFKPVQLLVGADATKQRFLTEAARADLIHFAGHAISNPGHPLLSRLLLAPDASSDSGSLFGHELQHADFSRARLVVLAACSTAAGNAQRGDGVLSLARSFVAAGVPSVVASLWDVDDQRSREFFREFYAALTRPMSPADALRAAQRVSIARAGADARAFSTWNAFVIVGGNAAAGRVKP
jgi:CHAT domain-containing protein